MAGCALTISLVLFAVGAFPIYMTITHDEPEKRTFYYVFGGVFIAVGLLMLYSGIHQRLAMVTPETVVELESRVLKRGSVIRICIQQPGPVKMKSLRANLVGEEKWMTEHSRWNSSTKQSDTEQEWHTKYLGTFNMVDHGEAEVMDGVPLVIDAKFTVPDVPPTKEASGSDRGSVSWAIEVWGKVHRRADFMHRYEVFVQ